MTGHPNTECKQALPWSAGGALAGTRRRIRRIRRVSLRRCTPRRMLRRIRPPPRRRSGYPSVHRRQYRIPRRPRCLPLLHQCCDRASNLLVPVPAPPTAAAAAAAAAVVVAVVIDTVTAARPTTRGLHSFTFQLNVSAFCGSGRVIRGSLGDVHGVSGVSRGG